MGPWPRHIELIYCSYCGYAEGWKFARHLGLLVADEVDGAAHVDVHKTHVQVLVQQLRAAPHGVWKSPAHLQCTGVSPHQPLEIRAKALQAAHLA